MSFTAFSLNPTEMQTPPWVALHELAWLHQFWAAQ